MESASDAPRTVSVYSTPTRVLAAVGLAICAALAVNLIAAGTPGSIWHFLPWLLFVGWGIFLLLWRPCLLVSPDGLTVRNILREHTIPFSELTSLRVIHTVMLDTSAGRISSWGAPGAGKIGPRLARTGPANLPSLPHTQTVIQNQWDLWERSHSLMMHDAETSSQHSPDSQPAHPSKVTSRWNVPAVVVGVLLLALGVISTLS
ncbi:PH domain-containing protein [Arthrobacter sp. BF1]|uniref:PH domain-containing protein n=1 Tax=Arthrobacter sp. BF1 TaxID=2821145 RepID=UPI001C4F66AA|nr:PH domain-containing protein [Arthrobacter sp. BF1]